jgi:hypothetical protein
MQQPIGNAEIIPNETTNVGGDMKNCPPEVFWIITTIVLRLFNIAVSTAEATQCQMRLENDQK